MDYYENLLSSLKPRAPIQYVQIGSLSSPNLTIPAELLRSKDLTIRGSAGPSNFKELEAEFPNLLKAVGSLPPRNFKLVTLSELESVWDNKNERMVVVPYVRKSDN